MAQHMLLELSMFQQAFCALFASGSPLPLLCLKEKREAESNQAPSISNFVSFFFKSLLKSLQKVIILTCHLLSVCERVEHKSEKSGGAEQCIYIWYIWLSKLGSLIVWLVFESVKCVFPHQKHLHIKAEQHLCHRESNLSPSDGIFLIRNLYAGL